MSCLNFVSYLIVFHFFYLFIVSYFNFCSYLIRSRINYYRIFYSLFLLLFIVFYYYFFYIFVFIINSLLFLGPNVRAQEHSIAGPFQGTILDPKASPFCRPATGPSSVQASAQWRPKFLAQHRPRSEPSPGLC